MNRAMVDTRPVGLPTAHTGRMPKQWKVSVGTHGTTKGGASYPAKRQDPRTKEFWLAVLRSGAKDEKGHLPVDAAMQAALQKVTGEEHPTWVPIYVLDDSIDDVMLSERGAFWGKRRWCHCKRLWVKTRAQAEADDLPWLSVWASDPEDALQRGLPWPPPDVLGKEAYYHGFFERDDAWGPDVAELKAAACLKEGRPVCDPSTCAIALGTHGIVDSKGRPKFQCKPHIVIRFAFNDDVMALPNGASPWGYVTSTGWNTHAAMVATWEAVVQQVFGEDERRFMPGIPLRLRVSKEPRTPRGESKSQDIPIWSLEPHGSITQVLQQLEGRTAIQGRIRAHLAQGSALLKALPESTTYQAETAEEFHHKAALGEPAWIPEARTLMVQLDMSQGSQEAAIENVLGENEMPEALLVRLREEVAQQNGEAGGDADAPPDDGRPATNDTEGQPPAEDEGGDGGDAQEDAPPQKLTKAILDAYRTEHDIPESVCAHIVAAAKEGGMRKNTQNWFQFCWREMETWVARQAEGGEEKPRENLFEGDGVDV